MPPDGLRLERSIACRPLDLAAGAAAAALWMREQSQWRSGQLLTCRLEVLDAEQAGQPGLFVALRLHPREVWVLGVGLANGNEVGSVRLFRLPGEAKLLELEHGLDLRLALGRSLGEGLLLPPGLSAAGAEPTPDSDQERRRRPSD